MKRKRFFIVLLVLLTATSFIFASLTLANSALDADGAEKAVTQEDDESIAEKAKAFAADQTPIQPQKDVQANRGGGLGELFIGVDDLTIPAYTINVTTNDFFTAFIGVDVWGAAYDPANNRILFNDGSSLYEWPIGGTVNLLGTITEPGGAALSMVGLAYYDGTLYSVRNIANEAVYAIDTNTLVATVYIDYVDADFDFGGLAADPNTGTFYGTNDTITPFGSGLFQINLNGTATQIAPYPVGQTDIDGLAIGDGIAYLITDEPGFVYVFDLGTMTYGTPLDNPWTTSELFSGGAWIGSTSGPHINLMKTVGMDPGTCAIADEITVTSNTTVYYCYKVANNGTVTMTSHDLIDSKLGSILSNFPFTLTPQATAYLTVAANITQTTVNTATWTATDGINEAVSIDTAIVNVPGWLEPTPTSYDVVIALGYSRTYSLNLDNIGGESVSYAITDVIGLPPLPEVGDVVGTFAYTFGGGTPVGLENNGNGDLLVTDIGDQSIYTMTVDGTQLPGGFTGTGNVIGVTTDGTLIYHTDTSGLQVHSYMPDGTLVNSFSVITQTTFPEGITYNPNTDHLYVVNGSGENIVSEYQTDGTHVMNYPVLGSSQDGVAYDPVRDSYWLYDSGTDTVREYDTSFNVITSFPGTANAGYGTGEGVAVIGDRLYVMATGTDTVVVFDIGEPVEAPWLHEVPLSGTVPVQSSDQIDIIFDATAVALGTYNATIIIENDGVDGNIQIPVTMTVSLFDIYMPVVLKD